VDYITPDSVAVTAYNVCQQMQTDTQAVPEWTEVALLIGTAAVESQFSIASCGRRLGPFGLDINLAIDMYEKFKPYDKWWDYKTWNKENKLRKTSWSIFSRSWLNIKNVPYFSIPGSGIRQLILHDIRFAAAMCRWIYLNILVEKCENLPEIADAWDLYYKAADDRGAENFLSSWTENECHVLMQVVGYN